MRPVLLHYHILKNAGSSIIEILARSFWERFSAYDLPDSNAEIKQEDLLLFLERNPRVQAVSSHQIFYPVPRAAGLLFFDICFLRDPLDRIRSTYDYFRIKPVEGDAMSDLSTRHTLDEFTRRLVEEMPWTVNNVQVNLLANGLVHDQPRGARDLDVATARMLETCFLGVVDCFDESLVAGQYGLRSMFPALNCVRTRVNESAKPDSGLAERIEEFKGSIDAGVYAELVRLNDMDFELLRRARAEVSRRFNLIPDGEERLRRLNAGSHKTVPSPVKRKPSRGQAVETGAFIRLTRGLRFARNLRMMRPESEFRRLFEASYYRESYPDVAASGEDPLWHFVSRGAFEGRNPHPLFDTNFYLSQCPQPPAANALSDYLERGEAQGRRPHPLFDPQYYAGRYPDVAQTRINLLVHYVLHGAAEGRRPHLLFQPDYYLAGCPAAGKSKNPLIHFAESEGAECCNPHPLFDCRSYINAHPEAAGNPLAHYLMHPPQPDNQAQIGSGTFSTARFTIQEVEVMIVFPSLKEENYRLYARLQAWAAREGFAGTIAVIWRTAAGQKICICAPQEQPFFDSLRYDQLTAQINGELRIA